MRLAPGTVRHAPSTRPLRPPAPLSSSSCRGNERQRSHTRGRQARHAGWPAEAARGTSASGARWRWKPAQTKASPWDSTPSEFTRPQRAARAGSCIGAAWGSRLDDSQHQYDRQAPPPAPRGQLRGSHCPRPEITHFRVFSAFAPWESPASRAPCGPTTQASRASPARISVIRQGRVESRPRNPRCQAALARQSQANSK